MSSPGYWQIGRLWWEAVKSWFHLDLKSFFALKNNFLWFLLGHITRWINVIYGSWMKWTSHHSKFSIHAVCFQHRLKVVFLKLLSIHDGAAGMKDLDVMLLWSGEPTSDLWSPIQCASNAESVYMSWHNHAHVHYKQQTSVYMQYLFIVQI